jgi:hypothetical protein
MHVLQTTTWLLAGYDRAGQSGKQAALQMFRPGRELFCTL